MSALVGLSRNQLKSIAAGSLKPGISLLDVGCGDGAWVQKLRGMGVLATGLDASSQQAPQDGIVLVPLAGNLPITVQSIDIAIIRGTELLASETNSPETTIALANLLSVLKPGGKLLVAAGESGALWQSRLSPFHLVGQVRQFQMGLLSWLTLAPLLNPGGSVEILEFKLSATPTSRLEWHRMAREAIMPPRRSPAAA